MPSEVLKSARTAVAIAALCASFIASLVVSCSTSTSSGPPPSTKPTPNGAGVNPVLNQFVTFSVVIPPGGDANAARMRKFANASPTPIATSLYVSPNTASVVISLAAVNGTSLAHPAPTVAPVNVPNTCAPAGCTVTVANVPAADGIDGFAVVTYAGSNASGSIISEGLLDVSVPTSGTQTVGSTGTGTLQLGGFVSSITMTITPTSFRQGVASTASVVVVAKDATGAVLLGNVQFADPVVLAIPSAAPFSFAGNASSLSLTMPPATALPLNYNGGASSTVNVTASTVDGNGNPVTATVPLTVFLPTPPPSPTPKPSPSHGPIRPSLYVLNAENNAVEEFPSPGPSATPSRSFGLTLAELACDPGAVPYAVAMVQGIVFDSSGNGYITNNPLCSTSTQLPANIYQFAPSATNKTAPSATFSMPAAYTFDTLLSLGVDPTTEDILMPGSDANTGTPAVLRTVFAAGQGSLANVLGGGPCLPLVGFTSCDGTDQYSGQNFYPVAIDSNGFTYLGGLDDLNGNSAIVVYAPGATSPIAYSALDGPSSDTQLGVVPVALAVDSGILYVLNFPSGAGLSNCGPIGTQNILCQDGNQHEYVTAYDTTKLAQGQSVDLTPVFVLGGDTTGRFGSASSAGLAVGAGQRLAVVSGLMYVANPTGPDCDATCDGNAASGIAPPPGEVDIYNVTGLAGTHLDVAPTLVMNQPNDVPEGVAIGPAGTATGPPIAAPAGVRGRFIARLGRRLRRIH